MADSGRDRRTLEEKPKIIGPRRYFIKEHFFTIQGEGYHAGTAALFIRFSACNMWSGYDKDRVRDAKRNDAQCPLWCDTDFAQGKLQRSDVFGELLRNEYPTDVPHIVLTGGEPLLQVDATFVAMLRDVFPEATLAVETNGTVAPKVPVGTINGLDWICVSPKQSVDRLKLKKGHELKVVYPAYNPLDYASIADNFQHRYVSAEAETSSRGKSLIVRDNLMRVSAFVMENPEWKLTLQSHKILGVP